MSSNIQNRKHSQTALNIGLAFILLYFIITAFLSYWNTKTISNNSTMVTGTHETIIRLNNILSLMKDAETGQRGYIITGNDSYLEPYTKALPRISEELMQLKMMMANSPEDLIKLDLIQKHSETKIAELRDTIELRRTQGFEAANAVVATNFGKQEMDSIRSLLDEIENNESKIRAERLQEMKSAFRLSITTGILTGLVGLALSLSVAWLIRRTALTQNKHDWLQTGQVNLSAATFGELDLMQLGDNVLKFLSEYTGAQAAAFFIKENGHYNRISTYGIPENSNVPLRFDNNDGLLGQAIRSNKPFLIEDVPDGYLYFGSAMGQAKPRHLFIFPVTAENKVNAVIELGYLQEINPLTIELLEKISEVVGIAVRSASYRINLQDLLEETQRQSEELQAQSEELKVSNEELEEQSRILRESQTRLEQQQAEMEQTNSQLEEQTQMLESQRNELERSSALVKQKANDLEQASQYKSNFLANMSHELRTPLNSSLILAKLLADNPKGNLTDEQVRFAQTIQSSGNDLLTLINDILDLSKIEAGHMDIRPESVVIARLGKDLQHMFAHVAKEKGLDFSINISPDCPEMIVSDRQRLEQILKNLISNALKFTNKGKVDINIHCENNNTISFAISDTGIGIDPKQQGDIFEAFKQADGTISRKYGGTGLGLSISRELTRLLGGRITLSSQINKGSIFTITIPQKFDTTSTPANLPMDQSADFSEKNSDKASIYKASSISDDRHNLINNRRIILVVEDDEPFARILYDLAHEMNFQCLITNTADEALILAKQYLPNAVLLDVGLPDNSGLSVLDRLKRDIRTRHIPVHVISANDYTQTALTMGAAGYMLKPVKREEIAEAFHTIETRFSQHMRRILIVEDDDVQRDSVCKLLGSADVETVAVGTAGECLEKLKENTFDCMVLDLSLPDASGYSLLETLSKEDAYSFPPVIVYTGRDLSNDDEQKLRRYSKSIIIKGAKSPERLIDEVTLFLHQIVSELPPEQQKMLEKVKNRDALLEGKTILVVEDDVRNVYAVTSIFEPQGVKIHIARNGREGLEMLKKINNIDLVLMDVMMPEMDGLTATREIRKVQEWKKLPIIMLTAKAMKDDQERCLDAGANDYMAKPLDVEKLLSLVRVWIQR